ncbi:hypothetical protein Tco_0814001 [Tanacetum coccineum]
MEGYVGIERTYGGRITGKGTLKTDNLGFEDVYFVNELKFNLFSVSQILGKFDGKSDEGFFVGYCLSSKAFRVYNTRAKRVEENLHIGFLENKPMIEGNGIKWLFDIDSLTQSMNSVPVIECTISNDSDVDNGEPKTADDAQKQVEDGLNNENVEQEKFADDSSTKDVNAAGQHVNTASTDVNTGSLKLNVVGPLVNNASLNEHDSPEDMFTMGVSSTLEATYIESFSDEDEPEVDLGNITNSYTIELTSIAKALSDSSWVEAMQEELLQFKLQQIKAAKPKVVTTAATTTTTRLEARRVVVQEPSEFRAPQEAQPLISKDKGKAKLDVELIEEQKLARKQEEEANIALIESWKNTQAMMEADRLLAERLQSKEREELTDEEKGKQYMELIEKRRKHFAALRAQEKRNRPPTKEQKRTQMSTYLKNMGGYTYKQLKGKSFDEIQKLFDKEMKRVNTFVAMGSEVQESKEKNVEGSEETTKSSRKKMLGRKREIDGDIAIDVIPLATKLPVIIDYKLHKEGMMVHYQLIRADGSSKRYSSMISMLQGIDREDLEDLWGIVKINYSDIMPEDEFEKVLWGDLKVMFEPNKRSDV